jgi:hypothetical protein
MLAVRRGEAVVKPLTRLAVAMMLVAGVVTWLLMYRASGWVIRFDLMIAWALLPYAALSLYALVRSHHDPSGARTKASFWACLIALVFALWVYLDASFVHLSSTSALVFLFVPLYILIGGPFLGEVLCRVMTKRALSEH